MGISPLSLDCHGWECLLISGWTVQRLTERVDWWFQALFAWRFQSVIVWGKNENRYGFLRADNATYGTTKHRKGPHRTAQDHKGPQKDRKGPYRTTIIFYFLFGYHKRWIKIFMTQRKTCTMWPFSGTILQWHLLVLEQVHIPSNSKSSSLVSWMPSATHSHWHKWQHDDVRLRSLCSIDDELSDLAVLLGPVRSSWRFFAVLWQSFAALCGLFRSPLWYLVILN